MLALVVLVLLALGGPFLMGGMMGPEGMGADGDWHGGMMWGFGWVTMPAFLGAVLIGLVLLVRLVDRDTHRVSGDGRETPMEIARRRYASGEISRDQYEQLRRDLESDREPQP